MGKTKTPQHLQALGVPPEVGDDRAMPRGILALHPALPNKKEILDLYYSMVMAKALPAYGEHGTRVHAVTHEKLAAMNGVRRETITVRMGRCSSGQRRMDQAKREAKSKLEKERARKAGKQIHNRTLRSLAPLVELIKVEPQFQAPNLYQGPTGSVGGKRTTAAEKLADRYGDNVFDRTQNVNGFKDIYAYLWHPRVPDPEDCECRKMEMCECKAQGEKPARPDCPHCFGTGSHAVPQRDCVACTGTGTRYRAAGAAEAARGLKRGSLSDYARVLATYYLLKGIEEEFAEIRGGDKNETILRKRKPAGMLQIPQWKIALDNDMDEDTVRKYNRKLEALLIIKVAPGDKYRDDRGEIVSSDPDKIIWMPGRLLTQEICLMERERFLKAKEQARDRNAANEADHIHLGLLMAWENKEHTLKAFWNELLRRFAAAGIPKYIREQLLTTQKE